MFEVTLEDGCRLRLHGRLDAAQADRLREVCAGVTNSCDVDMAELRYISSAGLGVLIATQRRLAGNGHRLRIVDPNPHIRELFTIAGLEHVFEVT
jgi:anti-sigma B factor antagonist